MVTNDMITRRAMMNDKLKDKDGTQITCEKCKGSKFSRLKIYGRSKQVTTTGAQLLNFNSGNITSRDDMTINISDDGGFFVDGTPQNPYTNMYNSILSLSAGDYYFFGGNYVAGTVYGQIVISKSDGTSLYIVNGKVTIDGTEKEINFTIQNGNNTERIDHYTLYVMLNAGTTPLPWEPYTGGKPSPSPNYPQEIESVGTKWSTGANLLDISKWNTYDITYGLTMMIDEDGYFQLEGTYDNGAGAGNIGSCMFRFLRTSPGTVFPDGVKFAGGMMKVSENVSKLCFLCTGLSENTPCLVIAFSAVNGENIKIQFRPMLYVGDTAPEWEPYTSGVPKLYGDKIGVKVRGKNLLDPVQAYQNNTSNYKMYKDGFLLKKGVTYTLSCYPVTPEGLYINEWNIANNTAILAVTYGKNVLIYTPEQDKKVFFDYYCLNGLDPVTSKLMLEIGENPNPYYEPYHDPQFMDIVTPNGLPGIPVSSGGNYTDADGQQWICDEIDFGRGVYVQRVAKEVLNGTEQVKWVSQIGDIVRFSIKTKYHAFHNYDADISRKGLNGFFSHGAYYTNYSLNDIHGYADDENMYIFLPIDILGNNAGSIAAYIMEQHENGSPLTMYYIVATPIETPLTDEQIVAYKQLYTYADGTAIISNDADAHIGVTYRKLRD